MIIGVYLSLFVIVVGVGLLVVTLFNPPPISAPTFADAPVQSTLAPAVDTTQAPANADSSPPAATDAPATPAPTNAPRPTDAPATPAPTQAPRPTDAPATSEPTDAPATTSEPTDAPESAATAVASEYIEYTIKDGDILYRLARDYEVTVEEIMALNDITNPESLVVGEVIRIPRR
jgi:LysM repeat protein